MDDPAVVYTLVGLVAIATVTDIRRHQIYNWTTYPGLVAAIALNSIDFSTAGIPELNTAGLQDSLTGLLVCGSVMLVCFVMSDMGGGDVKLVAMIGSFLGLRPGLEALLWTVVLGGVMALILLIWRIGTGRILSGTVRHLVLVVRARRWVPLTRQEREPLERVLFLAPAALLAVVLTVTDAVRWVQ